MHETHIKEGDKAPDFSGIDENGNAVNLRDYAGQKLILYFYPKDMTPGCTMESCNLRDHHKELQNKGYAILGVSPDSSKRHQNFIAKYDLPFRLLADEDRTVMHAYGVWGRKKFMGREFDGVIRTTFVIDENGTIERVFKKVKTKEHAEQILETYN